MRGRQGALMDKWGQGRQGGGCWRAMGGGGKEGRAKVSAVCLLIGEISRRGSLARGKYLGAEGDQSRRPRHAPPPMGERL